MQINETFRDRQSLNHKSKQAKTAQLNFMVVPKKISAQQWLKYFNVYLSKN